MRHDKKNAFLYTLFLWLALGTLPLPPARAQDKQPTPAGIAIGQPVPDVTIAPLLNYPAATARLSDFRGKLLLLEFGATWCPSCLQSFPRLEALQREFDGQLQVLFVTGEDRAKLEAFQAKRVESGKPPLSLPTAVSDSVLRPLFPYRIIPHVAWIGPDGTVLAMTSAAEVTAANIRDMLSAKQPALQVKHDLDLSGPLYASPHLPAGSLVHYAVLLQSPVSSLASGFRYRRTGDTLHGLSAYNKTMLELYLRAARGRLHGFHDKLLVLDVRHTAALLPPSPEKEEAWRRANAYTFDLIVPPSESGSLYHYMLTDLNRYSRFRGTIERRKVKCLVLRRRGREDRLASQGGTPQNVLAVPGKQYLRNGTIENLLGRLNSPDSPPLPIVDETGYTGRIDIALEGSLGDLANLRRQLRRYGLDLVEARRELEMFVLRDKPAPVPEDDVQ